MAFTQDLFTSRRNQDDGNTRIGETDRIWYDSNRNGFYIGNGSPGGQLIGTATGSTANVTFPTDAPGYLLNDGIGNLSWQVGYSNINLISYLSTTSLTGNLDLGNLYITDQTLGGKITDRDITLLPAGTGLVAVPGLKVPVGSIIAGNVAIAAITTATTINSVVDYSTSVIDNLAIGDYGLTNGISGANPGWTVYSLTPAPGNTIQVGDNFVGVGVPFQSVVLFVGNVSGTDSANANIIITSYTLNGLPAITPGVPAYTVSPVVNASLDLSTVGNVDIALRPAAGGNIVSRGSYIPLVNGADSIGTAGRRFKDIWLGGSSIYMLDDTLGTDQQITARAGNLNIVGGSGFTVGEWILKDNYIYIKNAARDAFIGTTDATGNLVINRQFQLKNSTGNITFQADRTGRVQIYAPTIPANDIGAFSIIGSTNNAYQPVINAGGMIHVTGNDSNVSRITNDAFGTGAFPAYISRTGRGNAAVPSASQQDDILSRISTVGWGTTNFAGTSVPAATNIEVYARENFTDTAGGTEYRIFTAPVGTVTKTLSMTINDSGISFANSSTQQTSSNIGITFNDGTRQTSAFVPTQWVRKITTGVGFASPGEYQGNVSLNTNDVHSLISNSYTLLAQNPGGNQNITLQLTQELSPNSSPTFSNVTVGNLTVNGTFTTTINATILGKILYLANNSTSASQIDGGGIILGNINQGYYRSILYDLNNDRWDTDSAGLKTLVLHATDTDVNGNLRVNVSAHFGAQLATIDFPNATIQIDENLNSYAQIVAMNHSPGTDASTDFVAVNNIGDDTVNYIDMGINSSTYTGGALGWTVSGANAGYLVVFGNAQLPPNGNLTLGTATPSTHIDFHTSGITASNIRASITDAGLTTPLAITSTVSTGTAPLVIASTTKVNNLFANRASFADRLNPGATINSVNFDGTQAITVTANASTLTGTYLNPTVVGSSLQTVGNLISLNVTGNINADYINTTRSGVFNANVYTNFFVGSGRYLTDLPGYAYGNVNAISLITSLSLTNYSNVNVAAYLTTNGYINNVQPRALTSNVHIAANVVGNTATIITDATTANVANTIVVRDQFGAINVSAWTIQPILTAVSYTATTTDYWIGCSAKNLTITLPQTASQGRQYIVVDTVQSGAPNDVITAAGGTTVVGGSLTQQGQSKMCVFVSGTWYCN